MGFDTAGIVGGFYCSWYSISYSNVAAGSVFAACTSLGMTGVFASSATVGSILGAGGLAAYINGIYNAQNDAELIQKVIKENDNPEIIIKLIESRLPKQRNEIYIYIYIMKELIYIFFFFRN